MCTSCRAPALVCNFSLFWEEKLFICSVSEAVPLRIWIFFVKRDLVELRWHGYERMPGTYLFVSVVLLSSVRFARLFIRRPRWGGERWLENGQRQNISWLRANIFGREKLLCANKLTVLWQLKFNLKQFAERKMRRLIWGLHKHKLDFCGKRWRVAPNNMQLRGG